MSGLELAGVILGLSDPLAQSIKILRFLKTHLRSVKEIGLIIEQFLTSLLDMQSELNHLRKHLEQYHHSIPEDNYFIFKNQLTQMQSTMNTIHTSLVAMEDSAHSRIKTLMNATKWANECRSFQHQILGAQQKVLQINTFVSHMTALSNHEEKIVHSFTNYVVCFRNDSLTGKLFSYGVKPVVFLVIVFAVGKLMLKYI